MKFPAGSPYRIAPLTANDANDFEAKSTTAPAAAPQALATATDKGAVPASHTELDVPPPAYPGSQKSNSATDKDTTPLASLQRGPATVTCPKYGHRGMTNYDFEAGEYT
jgi:hypothetical protein